MPTPTLQDICPPSSNQRSALLDRSWILSSPRHSSGAHTSLAISHSALHLRTFSDIKRAGEGGWRQRGSFACRLQVPLTFLALRPPSGSPVPAASLPNAPGCALPSASTALSTTVCRPVVGPAVVPWGAPARLTRPEPPSSRARSSAAVDLLLAPAGKSMSVLFRRPSGCWERHQYD